MVTTKGKGKTEHITSENNKFTKAARNRGKETMEKQNNQKANSKMAVVVSPYLSTNTPNANNRLRGTEQVGIV